MRINTVHRIKKFLLVMFFMIGGVGSVLVLLQWFLPHPPLLDKISFSQLIYDGKSQTFRLSLSKDDKYRIYTPLKKISPQFIQATLLQEDRYFYWHLGVNPFAMFKAAWVTYIVHYRQMGASTITMQLARLYFGMNSKKISGKFLQIIRALQLALCYSKDQILEAYLNLAPYGGNIEGIGAASFIYLGKSADQLSLSEALLLAVIPQNPVKRHPMASKNYQKLQEAHLRLYSEWIKTHPEDSELQSTMNEALPPYYKMPFFNRIKGLVTSSPPLRQVIPSSIPLRIPGLRCANPRYTCTLIRSPD